MIEVWYSPTWNQFHVCSREEVFVFKNKFGEFIKCYRYDSLKLSDFYFIGDL